MRGERIILDISNYLDVVVAHRRCLLAMCERVGVAERSSSALCRHGGAALKSGGSAQNESKFSVISSRRQPSGRRDGFRLTPLRMCSCGRGLARACLLVLPWSVCLGRPAESRARPGRAHSAAETAIPVALVVDFRALQVASKGSRAPARSQRSRHGASSSAHIPSGS